MLKNSRWKVAYIEEGFISHNKHKHRIRVNVNETAKSRHPLRHSCITQVLEKLEFCVNEWVRVDAVARIRREEATGINLGDSGAAAGTGSTTSFAALCYRPSGRADVSLCMSFYGCSHSKDTQAYRTLKSFCCVTFMVIAVSFSLIASPLWVLPYFILWSYRFLDLIFIDKLR